MLMADQRMRQPPRSFNEWRAQRKASGGDSASKNKLLQSPRHDSSGPAYVKEGPGRQTRKLSLPPSRPRKILSDGDASTDSQDKWLSQEHYRTAASAFYRYDPAQWLPTLNFVVTPFMLWPWALVTATVSLLVLYVELVQPELKAWFSMPLDAHVVMGGALSFLVVFRTNSSYDRWWEARCAWQTVITTCRSIGAQVAPALRDEAATELCLMQLMAFAVSLLSLIHI